MKGCIDEMIFSRKIPNLLFRLYFKLELFGIKLNSFFEGIF